MPTPPAEPQTELFEPEALPESWDVVAPTYDQDIRPLTEPYARAALDALDVRTGMRVLDVAAGTGALALDAVRRGAEVVAVDFSPAMVARLRSHADHNGIDAARLRVEAMDGQALALPDASFDAAASIFGLIFFPDRAKGLQELHRVLRPGGRVAVAGWGSLERNHLFPHILAALREVLPPDAPPPGEPEFLRFAEPERFAGHLRAAGFTEVKVLQVDHTRVAASAEEVWAGVRRSPPSAMRALFEQAPPAVVEAFGKTLVARLVEAHGDGPLTLDTGANLAFGVRPAA